MARRSFGDQYLSCILVNMAIIKNLLFFLAIENASGYSAIKSFDFIVVGSGTAGSTVTNRLSESGEHTVLLLEAGGIPDPYLEIPGLMGLANRPGLTKSYMSVPQRNVGLNDNGIVTYSIGSTLGGGSAVNGMVFNRGHPEAYNAWAEKTGDPSWNYENMLKYFKKAEDYVGDYPSDQRGTNGPVTVSRPRYAPGLRTLYEAGRYLGYPVSDPNGPQQIGFAPIEFSKKNGHRVSSYIAHIRPNIHRPNLEVSINAYVKKIVFKRNKAIGVIYVNTTSSNQQEYFVKANKEVILSAGVIESPVLLMKSGIGPRNILQQSRIPVIKNLPVGRNFQDHITIVVGFNINDNSPREVFIPEREITFQNYVAYNQTGDGPYSTFNGMHAQAFLPSKAIQREERDGAEIQIQFVSGNSGVASQDYYSPLAYPISKKEKYFLTCAVYLGKPKSIGKISLNTSNPDGDPLIDFRYFTHPDDIKVFVDGVKQAIQVYEGTPPFQRLEAKYSRNNLPACDHLKYRSNRYWRCLVRHFSYSGLHGVGTNSMGQGADAVVDTNLKVIGIKGLRVVDSSVIPKITNANMQAPTYALAEKGADMILQEWSSKFSKFVSDYDLNFGWNKSENYIL